MSDDIMTVFSAFQDYLSKEQELRDKIRDIVKDIEKVTRDIVMTLQNIHNDQIEENIIIQYCFKARNSFEDIQQHYKKLSILIPKDQYYYYHDQWKSVTQKLCFLVSLVIYLEKKILVNKETVAEILGMSTDRENGFYLDLEDFLMGILQLSSELSRFAVNSVTNGKYHRPIEIAHFVNQLNAGFRLLNLKNDSLRKRFDALKYDVKKIEEVVYDLSVRGLNSNITQN
ncbi:translin [Phymastichus coffea]|uniref:translin n=1 Tax=Phymastichus coffea TaxID=108790 RepID=UPI00273A77A2|nr:translin [Phymastichus coffea]XP_058792237.1 translin [Phymastichus coffea]XP_058792238.1 translin [Phymastichus coffea]XP_058792239.1 translin [Phymastichus coffea]XP_058792240.1 translin [Phymastichus coffea]XP_058792242.1 translin [Phymastichus coffea]